MQGPPRLFAQNKLKSAIRAGKAVARGSSHTAEGATPLPIATDHPLSSDVGQHPKIEAALESTTDFTIDPEPLKDALDWIAQRYQIPVLLDNKTLEDASIDISTEVKLSISGLKLRQALTLLLEEVPQPLGFDIQDGVLRITTIEKIHEHLVVVVYDCRDLIHLRSIYPNAGAGKRSKRGATSQGMMGVGSGTFDTDSTPPEVSRQFGGMGRSAKPAQKAEQRAQAPCQEPEIPLIRVIRYAGSSDDWQEEEGEGPKITEIGGLLVVNQNPIVHEEIKRILADLRRMKKDGAFATRDKDHSAAPAASSHGGTGKGL